MGAPTDSGGRSDRTDIPAEPAQRRLHLASVGPREASSEPTPADEAGSVWMTKAELARVRRISVASADRLIRRQRWRRQPGNDGRVRVLVPPLWATAPKSDPTDSEPADPTDMLDNPTNTSRAINALEGAVSTLREQLATAYAQVEAERARADRAEQGRDGERARADGLRGRLTTMQEQLADAHASLQAAESAGTRAERAEQGKERAETSLAAERARADALRERIEAMQTQLATAEAEGAASDVEAAELTAQLKQARAEAQAAAQAAEALRQVDDARKARGLVARLRAAWRGE